MQSVVIRISKLSILSGAIKNRGQLNKETIRAPDTASVYINPIRSDFI